MRKSAYKEYEKTTAWDYKSTEGAKLEGVYESKDEFEGDFGHTIKYVISSPDGTKYGVYGTANLNRQFLNVPTGSYVWIEYTGKTTSQKGRIVHTFKVEYDDEYQA